MKPNNIESGQEQEKTGLKWNKKGFFLGIVCLMCPNPHAGRQHQKFFQSREKKLFGAFLGWSEMKTEPEMLARRRRFYVFHIFVAQR